MIKKVVLSVLFFLIVVPMSISAEDVKPERISSAQLTQTKFTSYLQESILEGANLLYCSTIQLVWNAMCDDIVGGPLRLEGRPLAEKMLNERLTDKNDISENCYLAMAGLNKDGIIDKVKQAMKVKFNESLSIPMALQTPWDVLAYAFLLKDLKFDEEFEELKDPIRFKFKTPLKAFGIEKFKGFKEKHKKLLDQIVIYDYRDRDDFVLGLKSTSPKDEIIFAKITPKKTLLETIDAVFSRINGNLPSTIEENETLQIPKLDFDIIHEYTEIANKFLLNKGFKDYYVKGVIQAIRFRLDEKGVYLRSDSAMLVQRSARNAPDLIPRQFIFNKPFLFCMKEKGAKYPYFAMWIDNAELLIKYESPADKKSDSGRRWISEL